MPYTIRNARPVLLNYLGLSESNANFLTDTDNWGILYEKNSLKCVIFMMPLGENTSSPKVYFDVRDSGAEKFVAAWNYAEKNNLKFFCLGVKDENLKFKNYVVSIEADIHTVLKVSGLENGRRSTSGTQLNIPAELTPKGNIVRAKSNKFDIFFSAIDKSYLQNYLEVFDNRLFQYIKVADKPNTEIDLELSSSATTYTNPKQIIFYGVPGCGKSHKISELLKNEKEFEIKSEEHQITRTVFHPDYTNSDFIGQILPKINEDKTIEYSFVPGPFTKILANAYKFSQNQYVLIIEEINRGNAAAIFGEIFQLLDRVKSGKTITENVSDGALNTYGEGWSEYFFMNDDINHYILSECNGNDKNETANVNGIAFSVNSGIRLPPNLSILATMNTSDQNVFTLDNAFQRRWSMEYIPNKIKYEEATPEQKNQFDSVIGKTRIKWGIFRDKINKEISNPDNSFSNAEDKQLGLFFIQSDSNIKESAGTINEDDFANKVLKYLWNDVFKRSRENIFAEGIDTFGDLLSEFNGADAFKNTFKLDFYN